MCPHIPSGREWCCRVVTDSACVVGASKQHNSYNFAGKEIVYVVPVVFFPWEGGSSRDPGEVVKTMMSWSERLCVEHGEKDK